MGRVNDPASTTSPASSRSPCWASLFASHATPVGGVVEYGSGDAGLLDRLVAVEQRRHPAQVDVADPGWIAPVDHAAHGGVVADGVDDGASLHLDARVEDLQRGHDVLGRAQDVEDRGVRAVERSAKDEGQFDFDAHVGESTVVDDGTVVEDHVVEDRAVVGLGDAGRRLHHLGGQPDLAADETTAGGETAAAPLALHGVGVLDRHAGVARRQQRHRGSVTLGGRQFVGDGRDGLGG